MMKRSMVLAVVAATAGVSYALGGVGAAHAQQAPQNTGNGVMQDLPMLPEEQREFLGEYCLTCHNFTRSRGDLVLELFDPAEPEHELEVAEKVIEKVRAGMMPPANDPSEDIEIPERAQSLAFIRALEQRIDSDAGVGLAGPSPGLHRLNRAEYANAVRDLLGMRVDAREFLPADDSTDGFDNQAAALGMSPALLEAYLSAAGRLSQWAVGGVRTPAQHVYRMPGDQTQDYHIEGLPFGTRGGTLIRHTFPADGEYRIRIVPVNRGNMSGFAPFGEIEGEELLVLVDGEEVARLDWDEQFSGGFGRETTPSITVPVEVAAGEREIGVTFVATNYAPGWDINHAFHRSTIETGGLPGYTFYPHIGMVRIDGPFDARRPEGVSERVFVCRPASEAEHEACAEEIIAHVARIAYRGKHTEQDLETLKLFYQGGYESAEGDFYSGIEQVLHRVLTDPKFLYRVHDVPQHVAEGQQYKLSDLELASRLSFFLWSSIPDDELLRVAEQGLLSVPAIFAEQVDRMLDDERSIALAENFAGQWLGVRRLDAHAPIVHEYPDFDNNLREAFQREIVLLFDSLIREDRSIVDLLDADYTFLNERLARHYGISGVRGARFRRVDLTDHPERHGLLGKGGLLTATSQPARTSPVMRGEWILAQVIGVPAPPPPPDVPEIEAQAFDHEPTLREMYERHRDDPVCMSCHLLMDPFGFALENYDADGRFRSVDQHGNVIDASDVMYDGTPVSGADDLREWLVGYGDQFVFNATEKMFTYALGRGMRYTDRPMVRSAVREAARDGYSLRSLVHAVASSPAFHLNLRVDEEDPLVASN